jgi:arylsulfatase A-like enzyme
LREKLGELPPAGMEHRFERLDFAARAVTDLFLDDPECRVIVYWMSEPDTSLHHFGLGSPESIDAMRACDRAVASIMDALRARSLDDQFDIFLLSDHGHSTVRHHRSLAEYVERAGLDLPGDLAKRLSIASDYVYDAAESGSGVKAAELEPLVRWLQEQPWTGAVFGGSPEVARLPGVLPLAAAWHGRSIDRAPLLAVTPVWTPDLNEHGVPGTVAALTQQVALKSTHGAASPYDMHAFAVVLGPDFRSGAVSNLPAGATDIAPTVLSILGKGAPATADGRVLWETLRQPSGETAEYRDESVEPEANHPDGFAPVMQLHSVGSVSYLDRVLNG